MTEATEQEESLLIQGLAAHDPLSLEALIHHYSRELFYLARDILAGVGSAQDAEECLNDLFVTIWQEFESFDPARGSLRTWLLMRIKYLALDCRRLLLRQQPTGFPIMALHEEYLQPPDQRVPDQLKHLQEAQRQLIGAGVDVLLEQQERREELRRALEDLPAFDRCLVYQRYFQAASVQELAARTSMSRHAVEARLWRARKRLRTALEEPASGLTARRAPLRTGGKAIIRRKEG